MASSTSLPPSPDSDWASHDSGAQPGEHRELGFRRKYIFSTDHKVIGIQYGLCGLAFMFFAFCLMMMIRWQLAYPGQTLPLIGQFLPRIFGPGSMPSGKMTPEFYNSLGAIHGSIMIFAAVVPVAFAAFGNFVVPLQIGAPDMAFPKVNAASFWAYPVGGAITLGSPRILARFRSGNPPEVREQLNRIPRAWSTYFNYSSRKAAYRAIGNYVYHAVIGHPCSPCLRHEFGCPLFIFGAKEGIMC